MTTVKHAACAFSVFELEKWQNSTHTHTHTTNDLTIHLKPLFMVLIETMVTVWRLRIKMVK